MKCLTKQNIFTLKAVSVNTIALPLPPPPPSNIFQQSESALFQQLCKHFLFSLTQS